MKRETHDRLGFTLIELLVVVAIIAVLISILLPALGQARKSAQAVVCASNLKQIGMGLNQYAADYNGAIPKSYIGAHPSWWPVAMSRPYLNNGYLPTPAGNYNTEMDKSNQDVWNCPVIRGEAASQARARWTYLRVQSMASSWWGTADWCRIEKVENPSNVFLVVDGNLYVNGPMNGDDREEQTIGRTKYMYAYAGKWSGAATYQYYMLDSDVSLGTGNSKSGSVKYVHSNKINALFCDLHVAPKAAYEITTDMCEVPVMN